jgi:hypothetical protein
MNGKYLSDSERLVYFEGRLNEAKRKYAAKEAHPRTFERGYATETFMTWPESIALITKQIVGIKARLADVIVTLE